MKTQSRDTKIKTEEKLISLLQNQSRAEKFSRVRSLTETTINLLFIEYNYGKNLAQKVKNYLEKTTR